MTAAARSRRLREDGFTGCNVTYPLKEEAFDACEALSDEAQRAEAVNTIFFGRQTLGTITDGIGARTAIEALLDEPVALKRIGVLGYGATARAILAELHDTDAYTFVWGRDSDRVRAACAIFEARPWPQENPPEIVVSTLPPEVRLPEELIGTTARRGSRNGRELRAARGVGAAARPRSPLRRRDARGTSASELRLLARAFGSRLEQLTANVYVPPLFEVTDRGWILELIDRHPFGMLVTSDAEHPRVSHLPLVADERDDGLWIVGHVARANPHAESIRQRRTGHACLRRTACVRFRGVV